MVYRAEISRNREHDLPFNLIRFDAGHIGNHVGSRLPSGLSVKVDTSLPPKPLGELGEEIEWTAIVAHRQSPSFYVLIQIAVTERGRCVILVQEIQYVSAADYRSRGKSRCDLVNEVVVHYLSPRAIVAAFIAGTPARTNAM